MSNTIYSASKAGEYKQVLQQQSSDIPKPERPRDIVVRNVAIATNPIDYKRIEGLFVPPDATDFVSGHDAAGVVEAVGSEASIFKVGDKVYYAGDIGRQGTFQAYTVIDERIVGKKPTSLSFADAAAFPLVTITAWEALVDQLGIPVPQNDDERKENNDKSILIVNGAGGTGSVEIQLASRVFGLKVVATASRPETIAWSKAQGADYVVNHHKPYGEQFKELGIPSVDYVIVNSDLSSEVLAQVVSVVKSRGKIASLFLGDLSKADWLPLFSRAITLTFEMMFQRSLENDQPEKINELLNSVSQYIDQGVVKPIAKDRFPFTLEGIKNALDLQASGRTVGKIVLTNDNNDGA